MGTVSGETETAPANMPADVAASWAAMCPPVRARYAAAAQPNRGRAFALRWLAWEARRRSRRAAGDAGATEASSMRSGGPAIPADARILAIRPDHLGDVLLTTPALGLIKDALPTARITVLAGPWGQEVPAHCPAVDRVEVCVFPGVRRERRTGGPLARVLQRAAPYSLLFNTAAAVAEDRYHVAINFRPDYWWGAALAALACVPHRLGYAIPETAPFLTLALPYERPVVGAVERTAPRLHAAELGLALARSVLELAGREVPAAANIGMRFEPAPDERAEAGRIWRAYDLDEAPAVAAIHPVPGEPAKRWPPERFALVADHLSGRYGARVIVTGALGDVGEARAIVDACWHKPVLLAGHTTFGVLAALLSRCRFALGTDNGAMHLASAMRIPNLRLYGPTDAGTWGAWPVEADSVPPIVSGLTCSPCHLLAVPAWEHSGAAAPGETAYPCMQAISVDDVIAAVESLWAATAAL
ncbi:MAG: glycosyltransferase family 9 protein [Chloroflexi bacterium]|nr:glycosyltransferase family 9 protein [Chloroflexota bacterium]